MKKDSRDLRFGDYCQIEQARYGVPNEMYLHKVIQRLRSNAWVDVPVFLPATETLHTESVDVVRCICCGVEEVKALRYRCEDVSHADRDSSTNFVVTE